jgi:peptidoglycan LD-endopeptidase CwlK
MPQFGSTSMGHFEQVHPLLKRLFFFVVQRFDCSISDGVRSIEEQRKNVARGVSQTMESKHLPQADGLAHAVDAPIYPIDWTKVQRGLDAMKRADPTMQAAKFYHYAGYVLGVAAMMGIDVRWGGDWDGDRDVSDHTFIDLPHFELRSTELNPPQKLDLTPRA